MFSLFFLSCKEDQNSAVPQELTSASTPQQILSGLEPDTASQQPATLPGSSVCGNDLCEPGEMECPPCPDPTHPCPMGPCTVHCERDCLREPEPTPGSIPEPSPDHENPRLNQNIWYIPPTAQQVCHRDNESDPADCRSPAMTCTFEQDHGHDFYRCIKEEPGRRMEMVFHYDAASGKYLLCEECMPGDRCDHDHHPQPEPIADPPPSLTNATFCPASDNTFNEGSRDCIVFGEPTSRRTIPFVWSSFYSNCVALPHEHNIELRCDSLGSLYPALSSEGTEIRLRQINIMTTDSGRQLVFSFIRQQPSDDHGTDHHNDY